MKARIITPRAGDGTDESPFTSPLIVSGWTDVTAQPVEYIIDGKLAYTAQAGWQPPNVPALWLLV